MSFDKNVYKPVSIEIMSAKQFSALSAHEQSNIKRAKFNRPVLGKKGFGSFEVEYITPVLKRSGLCV